MPTYEYRCSDCGVTIEDFRWFSAKDDPPPPCQICGKETSLKITGGTPTVLEGGTGAGRDAHKYDR